LNERPAGTSIRLSEWQRHGDALPERHLGRQPAMAYQSENRRWDRQALETRSLAIYYPIEKSHSGEPCIDDACQRFVDLTNQTPGGATAIAKQPFDPGAQCLLKIHNADDHSWQYVSAEVKWTSPSPEKPRFHLAGFAFRGEGTCDCPLPEPSGEKRRPAAEDYAFFSTVNILKRLHRDAVCPLLNALTYRFVEAGERFVTQGEAGDSCFIIQKGTCAIVIEKDGECHSIAMRKRGDIIGEMSLLTGEPRSAHVEAGTDMDLWVITIEDFEAIIGDYPELRNFLTEIVADRFAASRMTAERRIGKYLITDIIGRGGFSIVYKGQHTRLNMPVVIKMLNHDMAMDEEFRNTFQREAVTIARFNHNNIIKVYDVESCYQTMFIVMEYIEGQTLRQILKDRGTLSPEQTVHYLQQVCGGLYYAHQRGIIHQDIKPGNLFILPDGHLKILDFGLACPCGSENMMTGTPFYMAPEQVECLPVDERTDIYALGLTAFEMLAGHKAFQEEDPHEAMELHVEQDIPDPAEHIPDCPKGLRQLILKACARDVEARYHGVNEMLQDLKKLARELGVVALASLAAKKRMATLVLIYEDHHQLELNKLMEAFSSRVEDMGITLKAAEFSDI
jgi:eukaryotic-like serine/threonine-protein kinase